MFWISLVSGCIPKEPFIGFKFFYKMYKEEVDSDINLFQVSASFLRPLNVFMWHKKGTLV